MESQLLRKKNNSVFKTLDKSSIIETSVSPALRERKGWEKFEFLLNKETGDFVVIADWATKEDALKVSQDGFVREQMGKVAQYFAEQPIIRIVGPYRSFSP